MNETEPEAGTEPCPNCGNATPGRFCPECGQRRGERRVRLRRLLADAVEDQFALNGALPRTLKALLLHPGMLTNEYMAGRIARYVPPFRLYLLSSFLFFLVLNLTGGSPVNFTSDGDDGAAADSTALPADSSGITITAVDSAGQPLDTAAVRDSIYAAADTVGMRFLPEGMRERVRQRMREVGELEDGELSSIVRREMSDRMPAAVFLMLPVYAGILSLLYIRRRRYYVEHFIFALHVHSFAFALFTVERFAEMLWGWLELPMMIWMFLYGFLALKRVYRQSGLRTFAKYILLGMIYAPLLFTTMMAILLYVVMTTPL